jgi:hypothetical protein
MPSIKYIVENIEQSVLVLGPGIILDDKGKTFISNFTEKYSRDSNGLIQYYFVNDNLIKTKGDTLTSNFIRSEFLKFHRDTFPLKISEIYRKLALIPFPLIISLNPDTTLHNIFSDLGISHRFEFFKRSGNCEISEKPSVDKPLIYNLFGSYENLNSLVLTYDDLFGYLKTILSLGLPRTVKDSLQEARSITFLGVEFDKWYFQLIVKLLTDFDPKYLGLKFAVPKTCYLNNICQICFENFEINFLNRDALSFINEVYYHCFKHKDYKPRIIPQDPDREFRPGVFISYKRGGESGNLANRIYNEGNDLGFKVVYDKKDLDFFDKPWEFMKRLGYCRFLIAIISEEYFKSQYCMYEIIQMSEHSNDYIESIFPVLLKSTKMPDDSMWDRVENFWSNEISTLKKTMSNKRTESIINITETIRRYDLILDSIPRIKEFIGNILAPQIFLEEDLKNLYAKIDKKNETFLNNSM